MNDGLSQVQPRLWKPDELDSLGRCRGDPECVGIGHPHIFASEDHKAPCDKARIFTGLYEARHPVEARVGIRASQALDESRNEVVVLLAPMTEGSRFASTLDVFHRDRRQQAGRRARLHCHCRAPSSTTCEGHRHLQGREHGPGVAFGQVDETRQRVRIGLEPLDAQGTLGELAKVRRRERLESPKRRTTEQRSVQREEGVLRRRADQDDYALLDTGQERVLLSLVETMYLVEEQDRPAAFGAQRPASVVELVSHVLHAGLDSRECPEPARRVLCKQTRHRRLACAGRSEEHGRAQSVVLDQGAKRRAGTEKMALADDLVQPGGAQAGRQWCSDLELVCHGDIEQVGRAAAARSAGRARRHAPGVPDAPAAPVTPVPADPVA